MIWNNDRSGPLTREWVFLVLFSTVLCVFGCTVQGPDRARYFADQVTPAAEVALGGEGTIDIAMGYVNESHQPIPRQSDFAGQWVLDNSGGEIRARGRVLTAGPLDAGETSFPLVWSGLLASGNYTLKWGSPSIGTVTTEFTVFDNGGGVGVVRQETSEQFLIDQDRETSG
jgi:hypothetical protein